MPEIRSPQFDADYRALWQRAAKQRDPIIRRAAEAILRFGWPTPPQPMYFPHGIPVVG